MNTEQLGVASDNEGANIIGFAFVGLERTGVSFGVFERPAFALCSSVPTPHRSTQFPVPVPVIDPYVIRALP